MISAIKNFILHVKRKNKKYNQKNASSDFKFQLHCVQFKFGLRGSKSHYSQENEPPGFQRIIISHEIRQNSYQFCQIQIETHITFWP